MLFFKTKISKKARNDIRKINDYLKEYNADKVIKKIYNDIENLKFMPRAHKTLYSYKDKKGEYRRIVSGQYIIIYKIFNKQITILRVFSAKQNYLNSKNFILKEKSNIYKIKK